MSVDPRDLVKAADIKAPLHSWLKRKCLDSGYFELFVLSDSGATPAFRYRKEFSGGFPNGDVYLLQFVMRDLSKCINPGRGVIVELASYWWTKPSWSRGLTLRVDRRFDWGEFIRLLGYAEAATSEEELVKIDIKLHEVTSPDSFNTAFAFRNPEII